MTLMAGKVDCTTETLCRWCRQEASQRAGPAAQLADKQELLKLLEREVQVRPRRAGSLFDTPERDVGHDPGAVVPVPADFVAL